MNEWYYLLPAAFCAGVMDAIGGGGGLLTLPALLAAGLPPHTALGTNKSQNIFGTAAALITYWHARAIDPQWAWRGGAFGFVGAFGGAAATLLFAPERLRPIIVVCLAVACGLMLLPRRATQRRRPQWAWGLALGIGAYDGFFGPGTGALLIAGFIGVVGMDAVRATAHAKVVNFASNLAAVCVFATTGHIALRYVVPMAAVQIVGGFVGARLALARGAAFIRGFVLAVAVALIVKVGGSALGYW